MTSTDASADDTLDLHLPAEFVARFGKDGPQGDGPGRTRTRRNDADLLDQVADWGPVATAAGEFHLVPVDAERDLPLVVRWMNDPAVAEFWELSGPRSVTEDHVRAQLTGDGRSVPCVGLMEGVPMSYWELYRADLDALARYCPVRPHDTGLHLLIGDAADRGRGIGTVLIRAVADLVLARRPACTRVVAEPDVRNRPSVAAFLGAGFRTVAEVDLPAKRAAFMIRDRSGCPGSGCSGPGSGGSGSGGSGGSGSGGSGSP
ncbi:GNAT family N-acetyltransferase [Streptomyces rochei]|uniref:GNAT family N-acetyltransferase n=1 Tax=Streptomyces rochei TaxID=1928 RepID=UPI00339E2F63